MEQQEVSREEMEFLLNAAGYGANSPATNAPKIREQVLSGRHALAFARSEFVVREQDQHRRPPARAEQRTRAAGAASLPPLAELFAADLAAGPQDVGDLAELFAADLAAGPQESEQNERTVEQARRGQR